MCDFKNAFLTLMLIEDLVGLGFPEYLFPRLHQGGTPLRQHYNWAKDLCSPGRTGRCGGKNPHTAERLWNVTRRAEALVAGQSDLKPGPIDNELAEVVGLDPSLQVPGLSATAWEELVAELAVGTPGGTPPQQTAGGGKDRGLPQNAGLYVFVPLTDRAMPIDLDPRRVKTCARVTEANTKVGKAENLKGRRRDYCVKTFGKAEGHHGRQYSFETTQQQLRTLESKLQRRTRAGVAERVPRTLEWYRSLPFLEACKVVVQFLKDEGIGFTVTDW